LSKEPSAFIYLQFGLSESSTFATQGLLARSQSHFSHVLVPQQLP